MYYGLSKELLIMIKILDVQKLTDHKFINLFAIQYRDRLNNLKSWLFASRSALKNPLKDDVKRPDAVVIVPFHVEEKKLVLIEEFRLTVGGFLYGFPAGLVDEGESVETAGQRELFEETGLRVEKVLKQSPAIFSSSGLTDESVSLLFVECSGQPSTQFNEASEDIRVKLVSEKEAGQLLLAEGIKFDVKTWIVLNAFATHGVI